MAASAFAQTATSTATPNAPHTRSGDAPAAESVTVTGRSARTTSPGAGLMRVETATKAVQTITRDFIAKQSPTTNMQQLLRMLPSTNVSDVDAAGLYSGASRVRGLDTTEVGYLLDGMPLNDIGAGQFYSNEVVEAEDLESVSLEPGSVDLDSPVVNASAGLVKSTMKDPSVTRGGLFDLSFGNYALNREFIRFDTGLLGNSGIRAFFAFSHTGENAPRGPGDAEKKHIDFKIVKDWYNGSRAALTVAYNDQINDSLSFPTAATWQSQILKGQSSTYTSTYAGANSAGANYYKLHVNPFANVVVSGPSSWVVNQRLHIDDTPYFWHGIGNGTGASYLTEGSTYLGNVNEPIDLNGNGVVSSKDHALVLTPSNQEQFRPGNTLKASFQVDKHNDVTLGWWYEYSNLYQYSPVGIVNQATGEAENIWGTSSIYKLPNGQDYDYRNWLTITQTNMLFVGDHASYFGGHLTLDYGFKEAMVSRHLYNDVPGTTYNRNVNAAEPLPQFGASWQFDHENQIYVSGATNFRTPSNTSLADQYSNTTGKISQEGGDTKSEYSISEEVGYRYNGPVVIGSISFFNYNFTNRQIALNYYVNGASYSSTVNAGGQTTRGVDIQLSSRPIIFHLRPYATFEYLNATIDNNLQSTGTLNGKTVIDYLPTAGKTAIGSPKVQAKFGLDYDDAKFFAGLDLDYVGRQYSTFMNDESMPGYVTNNVYMGYRFHRFSYLKAPQIQLNMQNLTGAVFKQGVYTVQNNALATKGVFGSTIAGSAPAYYVQPGFTAIVTLSTAF